MPVGGKEQRGTLDGTPEKRLFWSIISDYDTPTALCELVDNAVDRWLTSPNDSALVVRIDVDPDRQIIRVEDNAGGIPRENLRYLVAPGGSTNDPGAELIGVFGVGSKRAAVALAEYVSIRTRHGTDPIYEVEITKEWAEVEDWELPYFEVAGSMQASTLVTMSALRKPLRAGVVDELMLHFGATYTSYIETGRFRLEVNGQLVPSFTFDSWAFPKGHAPQRAPFEIDFGNEGVVRVNIEAGLILDRVPNEDNYGVYFYCNGRLIAKHLKVREVGYYVGSSAGVPHPDASLARAIVYLDGPAKLMPWNSSKTGVNYSHPVFLAIQENLLQLVGHFSSLSRRLKGNWDKEVFSRTKGELVEIDEKQLLSGKPVVLPALPRVLRRRIEQFAQRNKVTIDREPWTLGLVEAMAAVDVVRLQSLETRNRHALILLDSTFEIAAKEFIVHRKDLFPPNKYGDSALATLFSKRRNVIEALAGAVSIPRDLLTLAEHYYGLRNKLIHERATVDVLDSDIKKYRRVVQQILQILFGLDTNAN